jgi:hypothetical protein
LVKLAALLIGAAVLAIYNRKALACKFFGCEPSIRNHAHQTNSCPRCGDPDDSAIKLAWGSNRAGDGYAQTVRFDRRSGRAVRKAL